MSIRERSPMSRTSITVVIVLLCAAMYAISQGWFDWSRQSTETESNKVSINQAAERQSKLTGGSNEAHANIAADADSVKQDTETGTDKATELTGGVVDDVTTDSQARRHREVHDL